MTLRPLFSFEQDLGCSQLQPWSWEAMTRGWQPGEAPSGAASPWGPEWGLAVRLAACAVRVLLHVLTVIYRNHHKTNKPGRGRAGPQD